MKDEFKETIKEITNFLKEKLNTDAEVISTLTHSKEQCESVEFVVCGLSTPDSLRVPGTVDVPCCDCKLMVMLSPDSPIKPQKICLGCLIKREADQQQTLNE